MFRPPPLEYTGAAVGVLSAAAHRGWRNNGQARLVQTETFGEIRVQAA